MALSKPSTLEYLDIRPPRHPPRVGSLVQVQRVRISAIVALQRRLGIPAIDVARLAGMAPRTYHRRAKVNQDLSESEADATLRIARVAEEAERVFGDNERAVSWLKTPHVLLGAPPMSLLASDAGAEAVQDELTRIAWGDLA
ncbi:MAG TPA: antitoxin Xre/MbcA/ParS toxin-binding domain-containing protein [Steroidobacteraceae bacterium]|nr:antitoxin Xre/MbcA/ParS toxin-binding domain-containing protein [Steroidobacteraceae bacterium]